MAAAAAAAAVTTAGLLAAGTAIALAGTGRLDAHGMIAIPALHDAASDRPLRYTPVCSRTAIPVCLNPAYASYLPAIAAALSPMLNEIAGLPGAPARISQAAATYRQGPGNSVSVGLAGPPADGSATVFRVLLPDQVTGPCDDHQRTGQPVRSAAGPGIVASVTRRRSRRIPAQHAVTTALLMAARVVPRHLPPSGASPAAGQRARGAAARVRCRDAADPGVYAGPSRPGPAPALRATRPPSDSPRCQATARHAWLTRPSCRAAGWPHQPGANCHDHRRDGHGGDHDGRARRAPAARAGPGGNAPGLAARHQPAGPGRRDSDSGLCCSG